MTSLDIRKRLNSLRNLTQDLKKSTQNPTINVNYIKSLIGNLKEISETSAYPQKYNENSSEQGLSPNSLDYEGSSEEFNRLYQTKQSIDTRHQKSNEKQIIALREENLRLQQKIASLRQELLRVEQKNCQKQDDSEKTLPFFQLNEDLKAFICRFEISASDYHKVEYSFERVELQLDKIVINHKQKGSSDQLDLSTLFDVNYLPNNIILYRFQESILQQERRVQNPKQSSTNIFLSFNSSEQLKKWDLALFVNFQLVVSMQNKELFKEYFQRRKKHYDAQMDKEKLGNIKRSEQVGPEQQKFLLQMFRKRKEEFVEVRTLIQEKMQIKKESNLGQSGINEQLSSPGLISIQNSNVKKDIVDSSLKKQSVFGVGQFDKKQDNPKESERPRQKSDAKVIVQTPVNPGKKEQKQFPLESNSALLEKRGHAISFSKEQYVESNIASSVVSNSPANNFVSPNTYYENNYTTIKSSKGKDPLESVRSNRSDSQPTSKRLSVVQFKIGQARKKLQEGYEAIKYSKDGFYPHQKKVFLSLDCKKLCWSEKDKESQYKSIPLEVITKVQYGVIGEGIAKHVKKFDPLAYCVIEYYTGDYKKKTIELEGQSREKTKSLAEELQIILDFSKGVSMSALVDS